jgi:hypothetical protein
MAKSRIGFQVIDFFGCILIGFYLSVNDHVEKLASLRPFLSIFASIEILYQL